MNPNNPLPDDIASAPEHVSPSEMLGRIEPAQQLRILQLPPRASAEFERVRNLQIGGAVLIGILGLMAIPFGMRLTTFAFVAGIVFMILGLLSSRTNVLIRNYLANKRARRLGVVDYSNGVLVTPGAKTAEQFNLNDSHTMLRCWRRVEIAGGPPVTVTSVLVAQDGQRVILFSDEPSSSEEARDYNFLTEKVPELDVLGSDDRVRVPLRGLHELSRLIDRDFPSRATPPRNRDSVTEN